MRIPGISRRPSFTSESLYTFNAIWPYKRKLLSSSLKKRPDTGAFFIPSTNQVVRDIHDRAACLPGIATLSTRIPCYRNSLKPGHSCFGHFQPLHQKDEVFPSINRTTSQLSPAVREASSKVRALVGSNVLLSLGCCPQTVFNSILYILCSQNHINTLLIKTLIDSFAHRIVQPGKFKSPSLICKNKRNNSVVTSSLKVRHLHPIHATIWDQVIRYSSPHQGTAFLYFVTLV